MANAERLVLHRCRSCNILFYSCHRRVYCKNCIPYASEGKIEKITTVDLKNIEDRRMCERERWKQRMTNPKFRERERIRSKIRYQERKNHEAV